MIVADRFNDENVNSEESFAGRLDEIDSNKMPFAEMSAASLKDQFTKGTTAVQVPKISLRGHETITLPVSSTS